MPNLFDPLAPTPSTVACICRDADTMEQTITKADGCWCLRCKGRRTPKSDKKYVPDHKPKIRRKKVTADAE